MKVDKEPRQDPKNQIAFVVVIFGLFIYWMWPFLSQDLFVLQDQKAIAKVDKQLKKSFPKLSPSSREGASIEGRTAKKALQVSIHIPKTVDPKDEKQRTSFAKKVAKVALLAYSKKQQVKVVKVLVAKSIEFHGWWSNKKWFHDFPVEALKTKQQTQPAKPNQDKAKKAR